jgi:hypothetical protein
VSELTEILWQKAEPVVYVTKEDYLKSLAEWVIKPVHVDGELAWVTIQKGPEFHFQSIGKTRVMPLRMICVFLQGIIEEHGFALTRTPIEDTRQQRFNERFGFQRVGQDQYDIHYRIEKLPHA